MEHNKFIQAQYLRDCVGKEVVFRTWSKLLPVLGGSNGNYCYHVPSGSLLLEKFRGKRIIDQPWADKEKYFSSFQKKGLIILLTRDIGLSSKCASTLASRPKSHYLRIEEFIAGLVDALWINDMKIFIHGSVTQKLIKQLVRIIFKVGTYNLCALVDQWKEWNNHLFHSVAKTVTIGPLQVPGYNNIFKRLNQIPYISEMKSRDPTMLDLTYLSHLVSNRQMPFMGMKTIQKSIAGYKSVLQSTYRPSVSLEIEFAGVAKRLGRICRSIHNRYLPDGSAHISVSSSGEYSHSVKAGAQAAAVRDQILRILNVTATETKMEETPFGPARHVKGEPLWRTIFVPEKISPMHMRNLKSLFARIFPGDKFVGLDEYLGKQLMYAAWKDSSKIPTVRAEVVPEMGNKARIVTVGPIWLNTLQAPLGHLLIDAMKWHPSVFSSFHRQDQTWEAVKQLVKVKDINNRYALLSSDLKDATNAQQHHLTRIMLESFMDGFGISSSVYTALALGTIGPRNVEFRKSESILSTVGVMMGEPLAKPSLTLLNLVIEELAFLKYIHREDLIFKDEPAPYRAWRFLHIGGDDHLAWGPPKYLDMITKLHKKAGSHITPGQHGYSRVAVKYTERVINLKNLQYRQAFHRDNYELSTIVDSVKVRLMERGQSTMIQKDNRNVAIGKSGQLSGTLQWLPHDDRYWPRDKRVAIRNLFIERMGSLLPSRALHPRAYAAIHLPTRMGGFGLGFPDEIKDFLVRAPDPHRWLIAKASMGLCIREELRILRGLNTNTSVRGLPSQIVLEDKLLAEMNSCPARRGAITWKELQEKFPSVNCNPRETLALAAEDGWLSFEEQVRRITRPDIFVKLIMGLEKLSLYNTNTYTAQYQKVWGVLESMGLQNYRSEFPENITSKEIIYLVDSACPQWFSNTKADETMGIYMSLEESCKLGKPDLIVGKSFLGIKDRLKPQ
jgi:hypothetical protein